MAIVRERETSRQAGDEKTSQDENRRNLPFPPSSTLSQACKKRRSTAQASTTRRRHKSLDDRGPSVSNDSPRRLLEGCTSTPKRNHHDDPIFAAHEENQRRKLANTLTPSTPGSAYKAIFAAGLPETRALHTIKDEHQALLRSINSARRLEGSEPLRLDAKLSGSLVNYVEYERKKAMFYEPALRSFALKSVSHYTQITRVAPTLTKGKTVRLVSAPGVGALACAEMWCAGKYRMHLTGPTERQKRSMRRGLGSSRQCPDQWCPCHLRDVWKVLMEEQWRVIGVGQSKDGRWVVELAEGIQKKPRDRAGRSALEIDRGDVVSPLRQGYRLVTKDSDSEKDDIMATKILATRTKELKSPTSAASMQKQRFTAFKEKSSMKALPPLPPEEQMAMRLSPVPDQEEDLISFSSPKSENEDPFSSEPMPNQTQDWPLVTKKPSWESASDKFDAAKIYEDGLVKERLTVMPLRIMRRSQLQRLRNRSTEAKAGVWI